MANEQAVAYVKQQLSSGVSPQVLKQTMVRSGWKEVDVDVLINQILDDKTRAVSPAVSADMTLDQESLAMSQPKAGSKVGIIIIVIVLVLGGLAACYFLLFSPSAVMARTIAKTDAMDTFNYKYSMSGQITDSKIVPQALTLLRPALSSPVKEVAGITTTAFETAQSPTSQQGSFNVNTSGSVDGTNMKNIKFSLKLDATANIMSLPPMNVSGETRLIDNNLYFKADKIPDLGMGLNLNGLIGQWFKVDASQTLSQDGQTKDVSQKQVADAYRKNSFIKQTKAAKIETIGGALSYHYFYSIDKTKLTAFAGDMALLSTGKAMTETELKDFQDSLNSVPDLNGEIWIGIFDNYLHKATSSFSTEDTSTVPVAGKYSFSLELSDFNKPVKIDVPTGAKGVDELTQIVESGMLGGGSTEIDSDKDGLPDSLEKVWGTDPNKADTDADGYTDGTQEICKGYNPLGAGKLTPAELKLTKPSCSLDNVVY